MCSRRKGFPLQRVRRIMKFLQKEFGRRLAEAVSNGSEYHLLTTETHLPGIAPGDRHLKNRASLCWRLCLRDAVKESTG